MKNELVSIIIPVYNGHKYLRNCIESIINQTYKKLEIILINDGSTDNSLEICKEYERKDNRIIIINLAKNSGQSYARNAGVESAKGTWIAFCDNDDTYEPEMIEVLVRNAYENNVMISGCGNFRHENGQTTKCNLNNQQSGLLKASDVATHILYNPENTWVEVWTKIYHKSLKRMLAFPEGWQLEDYLVTIKLFYSVDEVYFDNKCLYNWYIRQESQSSKIFFENRLSYIDATENLRSWIEKNTTNTKYAEAAKIWEFCVKCRLLEDMVKTGNAVNIKRAKELYPAVTKLKKNIHINKCFKLRSYIHCLLRLWKVKVHPTTASKTKNGK